MARANFPRAGFSYYKPRAGFAGIAEAIPCFVADNYATALYPGDPVAAVNDGSVARMAAGSGTSGFGIITAIGQLKNADGVLVQNARYVPANTRWTAHEDRTIVMVMPADRAFFVVDADDATSVTSYATARTLRGENADHIFGTADSGLGLSGAALDISTHNTTNTLQWHIEDVLEQPGNDPISKTAFRLVVYMNLWANFGGALSTTGV